jgi:hypothetical protein
MAGITSVKTYIETTVKSKVTVTGSETNPTDEQKSGGIFTLIIEDAGRYEMRSAGWAQSFHAVTAYLLGSKANMLQTYKTLGGVPESICAALCKDETLGGACDTFGSVSYTNTTINLAGVDYVGYKITVNEIKLARTL